MVSTFTPNIQIQEPAQGDLVGTWGSGAANPNYTLLDLVAGANTTVGLNNSNVILTASQFQSRLITFNSTLTGSVIITFPTSFTKDYKIRNVCTGSSAFTVTLETTATGGQVICCPPGQTVDVYNDGTNLFYANLPMVGTYLDYGGSSVPGWISGCTIPPFLNCAGGTFSAVTYPQLAVVLGGTTLPDMRGTVRCTLNQGTGRMTNVINASSVGVLGGADTVTLDITMIPGHTHGVNDPTHTHSLATYNTAGSGFFFGAQAQASQGTQQTQASATGITIQSAGGGLAHANVQPTTVGGLTLIRAA